MSKEDQGVTASPPLSGPSDLSPASGSSQSAIANAALLGRLREVVSNNSCIVTGVSTCWHRNPEGPEAADVIEALHEALADLLENPAYQTAIGGNPNAVDEMLARAFAALAKARGGAQ
jgi:hypothetical protein